jgi:hypothetical protein
MRDPAVAAGKATLRRGRLTWIHPHSVYALPSLSTYAWRQNGQAGASAGILSYVTQDPSTGTPSQPNVLSPSPGILISGSGGPFGNLEGDFEEGLV